MAKSNQKKRHHYIPIAYLSAFTDGNGKVRAYDKDKANDPLYTSLHVKPDEIAFERYYYSQPLPDGERDNNTLEDFFSIFETKWPGLVERLNLRTNTPADFQELLKFLILMRIRVPATRDMIELSLAEQVKAT